MYAKNSNDNGDGSRYLFASDAKNYTWSGEETLRGGRGGKSRDGEEELQWSRNFVFFFFFVPPIYHADDDAVGRG